VRQDEGVHNVFTPAASLLMLISLGVLVLKVWALVDCATRSADAFELHGKLSKVAWVVILVLALLVSSWGVLSIFGLAGTIAAIVYLVDVRPAVSGSR
jgi:hypothetical protein